LKRKHNYSEVKTLNTRYHEKRIKYHYSKGKTLNTRYHEKGTVIILK